MLIHVTRKTFLNLCGASALFLVSGCSAVNAGSNTDNEISDDTSSRTITDMAGKEITLSGPVESYGVLTSGQMNVCALLDEGLECLTGAAAGGVTLNASYQHFFPPLVDHATFYDKNTVTAEEIIELGCQVMFWSSTKHEDLVASLEGAGIKCINVQMNNVDDLKSVIDITSETFGTEHARSQAESYKRYLESAIESTTELASSLSGQGSAIILGSPEGMDVKAADQFGATWLNDCGLSYLDAGELNGNNATLNMEQLLEYDPDYIFFEFGSDLDELRSSDSWRNVRALREGHCYNVPLCLNTWTMPGIEMALLYLWGASIFLGEPSEADLTSDIEDFYRTFTSVNMTDDEVAAVLSGNAHRIMEL